MMTEWSDVYPADPSVRNRERVRQLIQLLGPRRFGAMVEFLGDYGQSVLAPGAADRVVLIGPDGRLQSGVWSVSVMPKPYRGLCARVNVGGVYALDVTEDDDGGLRAIVYMRRGDLGVGGSVAALEDRYPNLYFRTPGEAAFEGEGLAVGFKVSDPAARSELEKMGWRDGARAFVEDIQRSPARMGGYVSAHSDDLAAIICGAS